MISHSLDRGAMNRDARHAMVHGIQDGRPIPPYRPAPPSPLKPPSEAAFPGPAIDSKGPSEK
jgi:hypothetical protein